MMGDGGPFPGSPVEATPIVVPNTLWEPIEPGAYRGGRPSDITHLADFEASGAGRRVDAR